MIHIPFVFYLRILPEIVLTAFGMLIMLVEGPARAGNRGRATGRLALVGAVAGFLSCFVQARYPGTAFNDMFRVDAFSVFFHLLITAATVAVVLLAMDYLPAQGMERGEIYALLLFGTVGMGFMVGSVELIMIFLSLEISSIATYVLAGSRRDSAYSTEAALKYLLLGSFATAFFLYGIAMTYGATGTTHIDLIAASPGVAQALHGVHGLVLLGAGLMFIGLGFKVSAAPFQIWTPDVYEGAPAPVTAFMSAGPKAAAFAIFLRIFYGALSASGNTWFWMVWVAAILSMTIGNIAALRQQNLKRMLAYSSIAHAGYVLVAFAALGKQGIAAVMFYLAAYVAMNIGAFAVIAHFSYRDERYVELRDYAGLGFKFPGASACLTLFLLSLIGIPLTGGFLGKLFIFRAALDAHLIGLTVVAVINSAIAAFYYLRVMVYLYMRTPDREIEKPLPSGTFAVALAACAAAVLWLGIFPDRMLEFATRSANALLFHIGR